MVAAVTSIWRRLAREPSDRGESVSAAQQRLLSDSCGLPRWRLRSGGVELRNRLRGQRVALDGLDVIDANAADVFPPGRGMAKCRPRSSSAKPIPVRRSWREPVLPGSVGEALGLAMIAEDAQPAVGCYRSFVAEELADELDRHYVLDARDNEPLRQSRPSTRCSSHGSGSATRAKIGDRAGSVLLPDGRRQSDVPLALVVRQVLSPCRRSLQSEDARWPSSAAGVRRVLFSVPLFLSISRFPRRASSRAERTIARVSRLPERSRCVRAVPGLDLSLRHSRQQRHRGLRLSRCWVSTKTLPICHGADCRLCLGGCWTHRLRAIGRRLRVHPTRSTRTTDHCNGPGFSLLILKVQS